MAIKSLMARFSGRLTAGRVTVKAAQASALVSGWVQLLAAPVLHRQPSRRFIRRGLPDQVAQDFQLQQRLDVKELLQKFEKLSAEVRAGGGRPPARDIQQPRSPGAL